MAGASSARARRLKRNRGLGNNESLPGRDAPAEREEEEVPSWPHEEYLKTFVDFMARALGHLVAVSMRHSNMRGEHTDEVGSGTSFRVIPFPRQSSGPAAGAVDATAIKGFNQGTSDLETWEARFDSLLREIRILTSGVIKDHPRFVQLKQLIWTEVSQPRGLYYPSLVLERASFGSLGGFQQPDHFSLSFSTKLALCLDVAEGLAFLHSAGVIHGDVKPDNILLFERFDTPGRLLAKISDFSHCLLICDAEDAGEDFVTWRGYSNPWAAPEVISARQQTVELAFQSDVFSFGLLLLFVMVERPDRFLDVFRDLQPSPYEPHQAHAIELLLEDSKDMDLEFLEEIVTLCLPVRPEDRSSSMQAIVQLILKNLPGSARLQPALSTSNGRISHSFTNTSRIFNVNEACIALSTLSPAVQRQLRLGLVAKYKEGLVGEDMQESLVQLGICNINSFGTNGLKDYPGGLKIIALAARMGSYRAMAIWPQLCRAIQIPLQGEEDEWQPYALQGCGSLSLIALESCRGTDMEAQGLEKHREGLLALRHLALDVVPAAFDLSRPQELGAQLQQMERDLGPNTVMDEKHNTLLHFASANGLVETVEVLLNCGYSIDATNEMGETALLLAMRSVRLRTATLLLCRGADIVKQAQTGCTPLHYMSAFTGNELQTLCDTIRATAMPSGSINVDPFCAEYESVPWHFYVSLADGTPLHWATNRKNVRSAKFLLELGADALAPNSRRCSPVYYALHGNMYPMLELFTNQEHPWAEAVRLHLVQHALTEGSVDAVLTSQDFQCMLINGAEFLQARHDTMKLLQRLLAPAYDDLPARLLFSAADRGHLDIARALLQAAETGPARIIDSFQDLDPPSAILTRSILHGDRAMFDLLMADGPDLTARLGPRQATYLHQITSACTSDDDTVHFATELITRGGIDVNCADADGVPPLWYALQLRLVPLAETLLEHGARLDGTDREGFTLLGRLIDGALAGRLEGLEFLLDRTTAPTLSLESEDEQQQHTPDREQHDDIIVHKATGRSALHLVASRGPNIDKGVLMTLLARHLQPGSRSAWIIDHQDVSGNTALHTAARRGGAVTVRLLLEAGARADLRNHEGETALQVALRRRGADDRWELLGSFVAGRGAGRHAVEAYDRHTADVVALLRGAGVDERMDALVIDEVEDG